MPKPLRGLVFDLDGTLIDAAADLQAAVNNVLAAHGRREVSLPEVKGMVGDGMRTLMRRAFAATGEPLPETAEATAMQDFVRVYQTQKASPDCLYPLTLETIGFFHQRGVKIGLCTNKLYLPALRIIDDVGMGALFNAVAGGDSFAMCKPHPGHLLGVIAAMGVPPENCAMIGDSANDILAAQGAKVASIAIAHGYGSGFDQLNPDAIIAGFAELPAALQGLGFDF